MIFTINGCTIDTKAYEVRRGGEPVAVEPQVFDLLVLLLENRNRLVGKDEIVERIWKGRAVSEAAISSRIKAARKAIGDDGAAQRFIRTVHRRGFRIAEDADVEAAAEASASPPLPDRPSIAVLPFALIGSGADLEPVARGLVEDLVTVLSRISALFVVAHGTATPLSEEAADPREVAQRLGVRYLLDGSMQASGERLRISAQLIDAKTGVHLWGERYDRVVTDVFALQDEITKEIVTALRVQLTDGENALIWSHGTQNIEAWTLVTRAVEAVLRYSAVGVSEARVLVERAVAIDPGYAVAWAILGITYWYDARVNGGADADDLMAEAETCAKRAAEIDPANPWTVGLRAYVLVSRGRYEEALAVVREGIARNPSAADLRGYLGYCLMNAGQASESLQAFDEAMRLNPLYPVWYRNLFARALDAAGDAERSAEVARTAVAIDPENFTSELQLATLHGRAGRTEEARACVAGVLRKAPRFNLAQAEIWLATRDDDFRQRYIDGLRSAGLPE